MPVLSTEPEVLKYKSKISKGFREWKLDPHSAEWKELETQRNSNVECFILD